MELLRERCGNASTTVVARAAHRIKGAARMFGDDMLAEVAAQLEQIARAGGAWEDIELAADRVDEQTERLFAARAGRDRRRIA